MTSAKHHFTLWNHSSDGDDEPEDEHGNTKLHHALNKSGIHHEPYSGRYHEPGFGEGIKIHYKAHQAKTVYNHVLKHHHRGDDPDHDDTVSPVHSRVGWHKLKNLAGVKGPRRRSFG